MAKFLTTRGTSSEIESIISTARSQLVLISPFVQLPETLFQSLQDADRRKVKMTLVYGKSELGHSEKNQFKRLDNITLRFLENLHAKCFYNEKRMVITSMNLYDFSEQKNREMGVLLTSEEDGAVFGDAVKEAELIVALSRKEDLRRARAESLLPDARQTVAAASPSSLRRNTGYCIRCGTDIQYDLDRPLCRSCFSKWDIWENSYHRDSHCHTCGKRATTSRAKPECNACYLKSRHGRHFSLQSTPVAALRL